jgi:hypothetical protein
MYTYICEVGMNNTILWNGKVWEYEDLPDEAKVKVRNWDDKQFDAYLMKEQERTCKAVSNEQFKYGPLHGQVLARDRERAKHEYWRGVSAEMNK